MPNNRTTLSSRNQPGGIFVVDDIQEHPGDIFFVDSGATNAADSVGAGKDPDIPFLTLDFAIGQCTASNGDVIYVMPGHNEGITTAANIDVDVAGVSIIGLGHGSLKPTIDFDATAASFAVGADNVLIENIRFRCSANAITVGLDLEAAALYARILRCEFGYAETATDEFALALRVNAGCDHAIIEGNFFDGGAQAAVAAISITGASDNVQIRDNRIIGTHSTACINGITTLSTNIMIERNFMYQGATEPAIELLTGTTGTARDNDIKTNLATLVASIVADGLFNFRNYYNEDAGGFTGGQIGTVSADD